MTQTIRRISRCLKELLAMLFFRPLGAIFRIFCPAYQHVWLVAERGTDARDNGYWFYRWLRTEHPEINARYVITPDSVDLPRISALGGAVLRGTLQHYLLYYCADYLVGTHVQPCAPDLMLHYHLANHGLRARGRQVFLQHGVIKDEMQWLHRKNLYIDLFICGAMPEYAYIRDTYGFAPGVARYVGLARWDNLLHARDRSPQHMILVMPTWRGSQYPSGEAFQNTQFFRAYQSLLDSPRLHTLLEQHDYRLIFYPHVEMQPYLGQFHTHSDRVILADKNTHDVQQLLMDCALLITDYSSVFFDVAYLEKPILYYQFDEEEFRQYHYQKGYFDYRRDGFGPVCNTEAALLQELEHCFAGKMQSAPAYKARIDTFFPLRDGQNCQRTYEAIRSL